MQSDIRRGRSRHRRFAGRVRVGRQTMNDILEQLFSLEGRTAVVTGGGGDLCGAMCRAISRAGSRVAVLDVSLTKAEKVADDIRRSGGEAAAYACDVLDEAGLDEVRDRVLASWGTPDILINGAGGNSPRGSTQAEFLDPSKLGDPGETSFFDLDADGIRGTFDLNFTGTLLPTKVFGRLMVQKGSGSILNMSSMGALNPLTQVGAYSAAKAAVANLTKWLAVHLAHTGVRVNALAPGFFMTEQLRFLHTDAATGQPTARSRKVTAHTPVGRYGLPDDLLGAVIYLLSDASSFVTGVVLPVDGGFSSYSI
ncbi:MAG TPA: SDR family oxidoreductase [Rectinemataceae bacterium]|nr:SDR family oxidoreductase [Rectinemataceae bacterium]